MSHESDVTVHLCHLFAWNDMQKLETDVEIPDGLLAGKSRQELVELIGTSVYNELLKEQKRIENGSSKIYK